MVAAFGTAWGQENEVAEEWRAPGDRTRAGLAAVIPLIEEALTRNDPEDLT